MRQINAERVCLCIVTIEYGCIGIGITAAKIFLNLLN